MSKYKEKYKKFTEEVKDKIKLKYMCIDELFTFVKRKDKKVYIWGAVGEDEMGKKYYFYKITERRRKRELEGFNEEIPKAKRYYTDKNRVYGAVYKEKVKQEKSRYTNKIENINSQMRDKIGYLVRKSKGHAKSIEWLDYRLAMFFCSLNSIY